MSSFWPIVVCQPVLVKSTFEKMDWSGQEAERGDGKAGREAAGDARQEVAGVQTGTVMVERRVN